MKQLFVLVLTTLFFSCNDSESISKSNMSFQATAKGASVGREKIKIDPNTGEEVNAVCYLVELIDPGSGNVVGSIEDCDLQTFELEDGTFVSHVLSTFDFTGKGTITIKGKVIQRPVGSNRYSTEAIPDEDNIINSTFDYKGYNGKVFLSGEIDLSKYDQQIISFNCNFTFEMESPASSE